MKNKEYYKTKYNKKWEECYMEAVENGSEDSGYDASISFDEIANAEEIVGYYLVLHKDPFKTWLSNIEGINLSEQDKEVTKILEGLEKLSDADMNN